MIGEFGGRVGRAADVLTFCPCALNMASNVKNASSARFQERACRVSPALSAPHINAGFPLDRQHLTGWP
jgi:hypothetical protein